MRQEKTTENCVQLSVTNIKILKMRIKKIMQLSQHFCVFILSENYLNFDSLKVVESFAGKP